MRGAAGRRRWSASPSPAHRLRLGHPLPQCGRGAISRASFDDGTRSSSTPAYAAMFGPTTGDRLRLADTELVIEIEADRTIYGEEVKFGGGKVIRDGMGQAQASRAEGAVDTVITNAVILDHWGIVKADIGIRDGRICGIGKAGNPDIQPGVDIVIGPGHRDHRRRGQDRHRRRHRQPYPPDLPAARRGGALQRHHDDARRRHRPGRRHRRDDLHPGAVAPRAHIAGGRGPAGQSRLLRQGQRLRAARRWSRWSRPAPAASNCTRIGAPPRRRSIAASSVAEQFDIAVAIHTDTLERKRLCRGHDRRLQGPQHPRLPYRGRRRRPRARHHQIVRPAERLAVIDQPDAAVHRSTPSTSISTC